MTRRRWRAAASGCAVIKWYETRGREEEEIDEKKVLPPAKMRNGVREEDYPVAMLNVSVCTCESGYRFSFFFGGGGRRADEKRAAQPRCIIKMLDCFLIRRLAAFSCFSVPRYNVYRYLAEAKNAVIILASNTQTHARIHAERKIHTCRS